MGWCTGSEIAEDLWEDIKKYIPPDKRQELAKRIVDLFSSYDADCWSFSDGSLYMMAYPEGWEDEVS